MKIRYFAWLRTRVGHVEEEIAPPADVTTVRALIDWLRAQSPRHGEALADTTAICVAVNHEFAELGDPVAAGDEIAFFPPVTGG